MGNANRLSVKPFISKDLTCIYYYHPLQISAGVWIIDGRYVFYNQFSSVTFLCPMRFERYPLDEHVCRFRVGATNMDINYMEFDETQLTYNEQVTYNNKANSVPILGH